MKAGFSTQGKLLWKQTKYNWLKEQNKDILSLVSGQVFSWTVTAFYKQLETSWKTNVFKNNYLIKNKNK